MSDVVFRVTFELRADRATLERMTEQQGHTMSKFVAEGEANLREDLERQIGSSDDWDPFTRSPFQITLTEEEASSGAVR